MMRSSQGFGCIVALCGVVLGSACGPGAGAGGSGAGVSTGSGAPPSMPPKPPSCDPSSQGRLFDVGPGKALTDLEAVPWNSLGPGDMVRIHADREPYRSKILLSTRGSEALPIRVCGVPDAQGNLPVIDGANAKTSPSQRWPSYLNVQDDGLVVVMPDDDAPYEFRPGYIEISGLHLTGAKQENTYTASTGEVRKYDDGSSAIDIVAGDHISIVANVLTDNGKGIFTLSKDEIEETLTREVLIESNQIYGNGLVGGDSKHNVYTQALGVIYQFNYLGDLRKGALGANLKDRSAGTIVRYNVIEGGQRMLDLVDAQEHAQAAQADPRYRETYVYGNVVVSRPGDGSVLVHYGGDTIGYESNFRKGTLYFYHNTLVTHHNQSDHWTTTLVDAATNDETVQMANNIFWSQGSSILRILRHAGQAKLAVNWISDGYVPGDERDFTGNVSGADNLIVGDDPELGDHWAPASGSSVIDRADAPTRMPVEFEFEPTAGVRPRNTRGSAPDLGAYEAE